MIRGSNQPLRNQTVLIFMREKIYQPTLIDHVNSQHNWDIVGVSHSGKDAWEKYQELMPDVLIQDMHFRDKSGYEIMRIIQKKELKTRIISITSTEEEAPLRRIFFLQPEAIIYETDLSQDLTPAMQSIGNGGMFISPGLDWMPDPEMEMDKSEKELNMCLTSLTERQNEIYRYVLDGNTSPQIGSILGIETKTVERHRADVCKKLAISWWPKMFTWASGNKLYEADDSGNIIRFNF